MMRLQVRGLCRSVRCCAVVVLMFPVSIPVFRLLLFFFFFFQAEDGIRDYKVTGVQTCALPIFASDTSEVATFSPFQRNVSPILSTNEKYPSSSFRIRSPVRNQASPGSNTSRRIFFSEASILV